MIEDIGIKTPLQELMCEHYDLVLFFDQKLFHITVEFGEIITTEHLEIDTLLKELGLTSDYLGMENCKKSDPVFAGIKEKFPDVIKIGRIYW